MWAVHCLKKYSNPNSLNSTEGILMAVSSAKQHQNYVCTRNFSLRRSIALKLLMASIKMYIISVIWTAMSIENF